MNALTLKLSIVPTRVDSSELLQHLILASHEIFVNATDRFPSPSWIVFQDSVNDALAWLAKTLQARRAAFRSGMNALTLKLSIVPTRVDSSELLQLLIQVVGTMVFALIEAIWYYYCFLGADEDASDEEDAEEIPEDADDAPEAFDAGLAGQNDVLVEVPVADADDEVVAISAVRDVRDDNDARGLLVTLSWEVRASSATRDAHRKIVELNPTLSWIERAADGVADVGRQIAEWPTCDDHYLSEDADDNAELADQNDEQSEDPVAIVMIVAPPLRRSKRVAAQQCKALRSTVAPSPYAITNLRRSARLAAKTRVNYKC
jgi:hypothetical protein